MIMFMINSITSVIIISIIIINSSSSSITSMIITNVYACVCVYV